MTDSKAVFVARIQAGAVDVPNHPERHKNKPKTRQPINDYMHERRAKLLRKVARNGGRW